LNDFFNRDALHFKEQLLPQIIFELLTHTVQQVSLYCASRARYSKYFPKNKHSLFRNFRGKDFF
jgi:hypothetical protein